MIENNNLSLSVYTRKGGLKEKRTTTHMHKEEGDIFANLTDLAAATCTPMNVRGVASEPDHENVGEETYKQTFTLGAHENKCLNVRMIESLEHEDRDKEDERRARTPLRIPATSEGMRNTRRGYTKDVGRARGDHMAIATEHATMGVTDNTPAPRLASPFAPALVDATTMMQLDSPKPTMKRKRKRRPDQKFDISALRGILRSHRKHRSAPMGNGNEAARGTTATKDHFVSYTIPPHARGTLAGDCHDVLESDTIKIDTVAAEEKKRPMDILLRSNGSDIVTSRRTDKAHVQYGYVHGGKSVDSIGRLKHLQNQSDRQRNEGASKLEIRTLSAPPPSPSARRRLSFSTTNDTSSMPAYEKKALDSMHGGDLSGSNNSDSNYNGSLGLYEHALELIRSLHHNDQSRAYVIYDMSQNANIYGSSMASIIVRHAYWKHTGRSDNAHHKGVSSALQKASDVSKKRFYDVMSVLTGINMIIRVQYRRKRYFSINHKFDTNAIIVTTRMWVAKA